MSISFHPRSPRLFAVEEQTPWHQYLRAGNNRKQPATLSSLGVWQRSGRCSPNLLPLAELTGKCHLQSALHLSEATWPVACRRWCMPPLAWPREHSVQRSSCSLLSGQLSKEDSVEEFKVLKDGGANGWKKLGSLNDHVDQCPPLPPLHRTVPRMWNEAVLCIEPLRFRGSLLKQLVWLIPTI